jgi:hypothetical protein
MTTPKKEDNEMDASPTKRGLTIGEPTPDQMPNLKSVCSNGEQDPPNSNYICSDLTATNMVLIRSPKINNQV